MKRSKEREKAMIAVYQYLLVNRDVNQLIEDTFGKKAGNLTDWEPLKKPFCSAAVQSLI